MGKGKGHGNQTILKHGENRHVHTCSCFSENTAVVWLKGAVGLMWQICCLNSCLLSKGNDKTGNECSVCI